MKDEIIPFAKALLTDYMDKYFTEEDSNRDKVGKYLKKLKNTDKIRIWNAIPFMDGWIFFDKINIVARGINKLSIPLRLTPSKTVTIIDIKSAIKMHSSLPKGVVRSKIKWTIKKEVKKKVTEPSIVFLNPTSTMYSFAP